MSPDSPPPPRSGTGSRGWMALAIALFLTTAGLAALSTTLSKALDRERVSHADVRQAASKFTATLLTYDYRKLDAAKQSVLDLSSGSFKKSFEKEFGALVEPLSKSQARAEARVTAVYLGSVDKDSASAITVANAASQTVAGLRRTTAAYFQLELVRAEGRWLVDRVVNLKLGDSAPVPSAGETTTTTVSTPQR